MTNPLPIRSEVLQTRVTKADRRRLKKFQGKHESASEFVRRVLREWCDAREMTVAQDGVTYTVSLHNGQTFDNVNLR